MMIIYKASGEDRKRLVSLISEFTGVKAEYMRMPTQAYRIDHFTVDKEGNLYIDDLADSEEFEKLLEHLHRNGFIAESKEGDAVVERETAGLVIQMPITYFEGDALENLNRIMEAKGKLIKKALGLTELTITVDEERVSFPWFSMGPSDSDSTEAYTHFISSICEMAKNQKRISSKEKEVSNEKYAFRCFLLRLGFIGDTYKKERKILLQNLEGSSAYKTDKKGEDSNEIS